MTPIAVAADAVPASPLPVGGTVKLAYRSAYVHRGALLRIAWFWCLALLALQGLSVLLLPTWMTNPAEIMHLDAPALLAVSFAGLVNGLVILPMLASIAVNWHRLLLLDEQPKPGAFLRLDGLVWSYVAMAALLAALRFVMSLPQVMVALQPIQGGPGMSLHRAMAALLSIGVLVMLPRLSLALPGVALGDAKVGLARGLGASRGNTWRLFFGVVLCLTPAAVLAVINFGIWPGYAVMLSNEPLGLWVRAVEAMLWPFIGIVVVGYLSHAYAHFFPQRVAAARAAQT